MSESESFIEEVSEEVRRDRLFALFRRYGWIAILAILLIVGGAAYNEWNKSQILAERQAKGDMLLAALNASAGEERLNALEAAAAASSGAEANLVRMHQAAALVDAGDEAAAVDILLSIAADPDAGVIYGDLARLKVAMMQHDAEATAPLLDQLTTPGRPFRLLALEVRAQRKVDDGDTDGAIGDLIAILEDPQTTPALRERAERLTVILGGEVPENAQLLPLTQDG